MADYHPLITRAVTALEKDTAENRRVLYERARTALVSQLRGTVPPLDEAEITRERLALEEAIRRVEVESARRAREAPKDLTAELSRSPRREPPPRPEPARLESARPEPARSQPAAFEPARIPAAPPEPGPERFGEVVHREAIPEQAAVQEQVAPQTAPVPAALPEEHAAAESAPIPPELASEPSHRMTDAPRVAAMKDTGRFERESKFDDALKKIRDVAGSLRPGGDDTQVKRPRPIIAPVASPGPPMAPQYPEASEIPEALKEPEVLKEPDALKEPEVPKEPAAFESEPAQDWPLPAAERFAARNRPEHAAAGFTATTVEETVRPLRPPRVRSYRRIMWMSAILLCIFGAGALAYWQGGALMGLAKNTVAAWRSPATPAPKDATTSRKNTDRIGQPESARASKDGATQRAMLTTEDANSASGRDYVGSANWKVETIPASPGRPAEVTIKLEVDIPDRGFAMVWTIKRNTDPTLPATHTIDIEFNIAENSPLGSIAEIRSLLMKKTSDTEGKPLWGHAQKSTPNYFLVGLSATPADAQYNLALLKEQPAFDIALVFTKARRAFLLIEKGPAGEKAFADAFAAWKQ